MPEAAPRRRSIFERLYTSRTNRHSALSPTSSHSDFDRNERTPLLPLSHPDLPTPKSSLDRNAAWNGDNSNIFLETDSHNKNYSTDDDLSLRNSNPNDKLSPSFRDRMSEPNSPGTPSKGKRKSILGKSRKAFGRPLRAVGRAVGRKSRIVDVEELSEQETSAAPDEIVVLTSPDRYGSLVEVPEGDDEDLSNDLILSGSNHSARRRNSRTSLLLDLPTERRDPEWPVHSMEQFMRTLLLMSGAYVFGCKRPEWMEFVAKATEYVLTAWVTCVVILVLAYLQKQLPQWSSPSPLPEEERNLSHRSERKNVREYRRNVPLRNNRERQNQATEPLPQLRSAIDQTMSSEGSVVSAFQEQPQLAHPALSSFYIIDTLTGDRIYPNSQTPIHLSTEWFEMDMLVLVRTPDVDDKNDTNGAPFNKKWVDYLSGRQRRFEFQYQMKLKKIPQDKSIYFSCEVDEPIKMGLVQRAFVGAAMAFMKSTNPTFHYSITGSKDRAPDGKYEKPHMSFPVEGSLDRLVVTKPGDTPPELGTAIQEDPESMKRRKKGELIDWNLEDTYTMALWTAYVDFIDWRVLNLPGIRPFTLGSVLGTQAFSLGLYLIDEKRDTDKHYVKDITNVVKLELSSEDHAEKGHFARRWKKANERRNDPPQLPLTRCTTSDEIKHPIDTGLSDNVACGIQASKSADEFDAEDVEIAEDDEDAETAAELGEGIYLRSGDSVCLRQFLPGNEVETSKTFNVANGGGFAILQEQEVTIQIEKTRRSKKNRLIKSGDTVLFKMIQKNKNGETETRYLSIHRGWWLKWVSTVPSKNGFFTIYPAETETLDKSVRTAETQASFLTLGGSFTLRHKRWSKYHVGVAGEPSPTYGGRLLGLYNPESKDQADDEQYHSDEGEPDETDPELKNKPNWMKPLILTAVEQANLGVPSLPISPRAKREIFSNEFFMKALEDPYNPLMFSSEGARADVPAWIEMMNRTRRVRQLAYVVRVTQRPRDEHDYAYSESEPDTFMRLRYGRELSQIMRVGQTIRKHIPKESLVSMNGSNRGHRRPERGPTAITERIISNGRSEAMAKLTLSPREDIQAVPDIPIDASFDSAAHDFGSDDDTVESGEEENREENRSEIDEAHVQPTLENDEEEDAEPESEVDEVVESDNDAETEQDERRKKRGVVGKSKSIIGKSVKATAGGVVRATKLTGKGITATGKLSAKAVVGASKLTGKAAVRGGKKAVNVGKSAGRAVIAPVSRKAKKPPKRAEPRNKHKEKDLVAVPRTMRKMAKKAKMSAGSPDFLAGELCAPEQSCRTASRLLSRMSSLPAASPYWKRCNDVLTSQVQYEMEQDRWFLEGTSVELGVVPLVDDASRGKLLHESLVARCLYESHWREEWCGMYSSCVSIYTPLSKTPCLELAYVDITGVRPLPSSAYCPLPGCPVLVLETAWLCHYLAFRDEEARDTFGEKVEEAIEIHLKQVEETASLQEDDLRKARFWQGVQTLSESLSSGTGKWAKIQSKDKLKERIILNGRRMPFDDSGDTLRDISNGFAFVEELLTRALSFSLESLEKDPLSFVEFLDFTSQLKLLPLDEVDLSSKDALCLFANIYHCLLQQALLMSVTGPLHKKTYVQFMRTACYEIGGDIFSLAELYSCVLRGKLCRPARPSPPYVEAPKKSLGYSHYALDMKDPRVNFLLNTADVACPREVTVLRVADVENQLNEAASAFLEKELGLLPMKRVVILPKVCEVYKNDFGNDSMACLKFCMGGLDEGTTATIRGMMADMSNFSIRYKPSTDQYHTSLKIQMEDKVIDEMDES